MRSLSAYLRVLRKPPYKFLLSITSTGEKTKKADEASQLRQGHRRKPITRSRRKAVSDRLYGECDRQVCHSTIAKR